MRSTRLVPALIVAWLALATTAAAQTADRPWSADFSIGWDNGVSGNIVSAAVGTLFNLATVVDNRSYDDIYGTGVRWSLGAGYRIRERQELRGTFTYSTASADARQIGNTGGSPLFATFQDYTVWGFDVGYRQYFQQPQHAPRVTPYAGASIGGNVIREIDTDLAVPDLNLTAHVPDFYDRTGAFTFQFNGGALIAVHERVDADVRLGLQYVTGLATPDNLVGTGLEGISNETARWILPFTVGLRVKF